MQFGLAYGVWETAEGAEAARAAIPVEGVAEYGGAWPAAL